MQNSICISERNETSLANNDVMTTKELAQALGIDVKTIQKTSTKLFDIDVVKSVSYEKLAENNRQVLRKNTEQKNDF